MCGSGGSSGTQRFEWNEGVAPYWEQALGMGNWLSGLGLNGTEGKPYERYEGQRIANLNDDQIDAMDNIRHYVGTVYGPTGDAGRQLSSTLQDDYLLGDKRNPAYGQTNPWATFANPTNYEKNPFASDTTRPTGNDTLRELNPLASGQTNVQRNMYAGENPYFRQTVQNTLDDVIGAYKRGTSADTTRLFNLSGAFGGSAHQNAIKNNEEALAKQLGSVANQMYSDQYGRSAGLEEAYLGRDVQGQQFDRGLNSNLYEQMLGRQFQGTEAGIGRDLQAQMFDKQQGGNWWEAMMGRTSGNIEGQLNRGNQDVENQFQRMFGAYEGERGRQIGSVPAAQNDQNLILQRLNALMGIGDVQRSYEQDYLNQYYGDWQDEQQHPYRMLDYMSGLISRAQGGVSPNMTQTQPSYQASPFSQLIGAGLFGRSMGWF